MRASICLAGQRDVSNSASGGCSPVNTLSEHETTHDSELLTVDQIIDSVLENVTKAAAVGISKKGQKVDEPAVL